MTPPIFIRLGPLACALEGLEFAVQDGFNELGNFVLPSRERADAYFRITAGTEDSSSWQKATIRSFEVDPGGRFVSVTKDEWVAEIDLNEAQVTAHLRGTWPRAVDSLLGSTVQILLLATGAGLAFHGSCVMRDGRAYVFMGPSSAGKTTAAFLSREVGAEILAEELTAVGLEDDGPHVWTLPLWQKDGTRPAPRRAPLRAVLVLEQASVHDVVELSREEAVRALLRTVTIGVRAPLLMDLAAGAVSELVKLVPVRRLRFRKDPGFWDVIDEAVW